MIADTFRVREKDTGKVYDCMTQSVDLNFDGRQVLRYNIGINGYTEWSCICCVYDNDDFNRQYEILPNGRKTKTEITTSHLEADDITIIFEQTYDITKVDNFTSPLFSTEIVGWYHGEPNDSDTKKYSNREMKANY